PTKPAYTLASVPLTSVEALPTNQIMMIRTTAYSHLQADSLPYGRKSAAGTTLQYGNKIRSAAADWSKYPLGTKFQIEGLPYIYVVDDYGSALCGTETIDIYKPNLSGIGKWGVRNVPVRVIEWGSFEESAKILRTRTHVRHAHHVRKMLSEIERKGRAGYLRPSGGSA
ncbi:MAG: 3D domain-containing protein, partial [Verrucomicrobiota bacterium]